MRHIREAKESDLDNIRKVISAAIRQCVIDSDEQYEPLYAEVCSYLDWWVENKDRSVLLVCQDDDSVLGMAFVAEFWRFSALFVDPKCHRSGIGRELVESIIDSCKGRSPKESLSLNSSTYAAPFYEKLGFTQTGEALDRPGGCVPFKYDF